MQRVHESGGHVNVVYLTDGDGYHEGVQSEGHVESPSASDYRGYGRQRRREARDALAALGLDRASHTFLSFPDGGLCKLTRTYWSERRTRSEEHTSELQSRFDLVCRLLLEKKKKKRPATFTEL